MVTVGKRASGVAAQPTRKRLILGALYRCTPKGLAKIGEVGKALDRQIRYFPGLGRYADPPFPGGFFAYRFWVFRPHENRDRTRRIARTWRACPIIVSSST